MSITLRQLCASDNYRYGLHMVAGEEGLDAIVQWVHTLEDVEVGDFLHGGELIFTTGIGHRDMESLDWLLPLVRKLNKNEASGIVINTGPYIKEVTKEVIEYGNEYGFPIFTMPWEVHVVDVTRDFCSQIIAMDKREENIGSILQNIIFYPGELEKYAPQLEQNGFYPATSCCLLGIKLISDKKMTMQNCLFTKQYIKRKIKSFCELTGSFELQEVMYFALGDLRDFEVRQLINELQELNQEKQKIYISAGSNYDNLDNLSQNYRRVSMMLHLCESKERSVLIYDDLGMKKLLLSISDLDFLKRYEREILGKLEEYDDGNNTNLLEIFKIYLDCDGSVQRVAEQTFTHRNTVNYQIKKIKNIIGSDISCLERKCEIMLAYQIRDMLK